MTPGRSSRTGMPSGMSVGESSNTPLLTSGEECGRAFELAKGIHDTKKSSDIKAKQKKKSGSSPIANMNRPKKSPYASKSLKLEKELKQMSMPESDTDESEVSFEEYNILCERFAKTMYYSNPTKPSSTPRPSLPLTILAVDTFSKYARKDTLEFLDIDMAADIGRNACVSPTALVFALVYLERLSANNPGYLKTVKPSELFVVSLLVASKFVQDDGEDLGIFNDEWATSANMELTKLNKLELEFLTAMDWSVNIDRDTYERALKRIEEKVALRQGIRRGWFTYTELKSVTPTHFCWNAVLPIVYERVVEVASAICVMYTTMFATLITSSVLAPYLLSVSKMLLMLSSGSNSVVLGSSLASCMQDISMQNSSLLGHDVPGTTQAANVQRLVPLKHLLPPLSIEDLENDTDVEIGSSAIDHTWQQQMQTVLHRHRRFYETGTENYGFSFKCKSDECNYHSQDEALANVQRVLENLLHSSNILNSNHPYGEKIDVHYYELGCSNTGKCVKPTVTENFIGTRHIKV